MYIEDQPTQLFTKGINIPLIIRPSRGPPMTPKTINDKARDVLPNRSAPYVNPIVTKPNIMAG